MNRMLIFAALLFATLTASTHAAAEPAAEPEPALDYEPIVIQTVWPADGADLSTTPEIWVQYEPTSFWAMLVDDDTGTEYFLVNLDAETATREEVSFVTLHAMRPVTPLPVGATLTLIAENNVDRVTVASFTTSDAPIDDLVVPAATPTLEIEVTESRVDVIGRVDVDLALPDHVLGLPYAVGESADNLGGIYVLPRDTFDGSRYAGLRRGARLTGPRDVTFCIAVGAAAVDQARIQPDVSAPVCTSLNITASDWAEIVEEQERLNAGGLDPSPVPDEPEADAPGTDPEEEVSDEPEEGPNPSPLFLACADAGPATQSTAPAVALMLFGLVAALRRRRV